MKKIMHGILLAGFSLLLPGGCSSPENTVKPSRLLSQNTMCNLLTEIYRIDATQRVCQRENIADGPEYCRQEWDSLLHVYGINDTILKENILYYMSRSDLADTLLSRVTNRLTAIEATKAEAMRKETDYTGTDRADEEQPDFGEIIFN